MKALRTIVGGAALCALFTSALPNLEQAGKQDDLAPVGQPGGPGRPLADEELERFKRGLALFDRDFTPADGLGSPEMNADSCRACHQDPAVGGAGGLDLNVSRHAFDNNGDGPFQNPPEGQMLSKLRPPTAVGREEYDEQSFDLFEQRQTPSIFGDGLIETIFESEILFYEDPDDRNGDGIAGRARRVDVGGGAIEIGRFGWKAQVPTLEDFVRDAMGGECGITTPDDGRGFALVSDGDAVADPELSEEEVDDLTFFMANLAAPVRKKPTDPQVIQGEILFEQIGCVKCHVPALNGTQGPVFLYSDLLLHNVQGGSPRLMEEDGAPAGYYRTPPLWGVSQTAPYFHDGRAEHLRKAINLHRFEARDVRLNWGALPEDGKQAVLAFLNDL